MINVQQARSPHDHAIHSQRHKYDDMINLHCEFVSVHNYLISTFPCLHYIKQPDPTPHLWKCLRSFRKCRLVPLPCSPALSLRLWGLGSIVTTSAQCSQYEQSFEGNLSQFT